MPSAIQAKVGAVKAPQLKCVLTSSVCKVYWPTHISWHTSGTCCLWQQGAWFLPSAMQCTIFLKKGSHFVGWIPVVPKNSREIRILFYAGDPNKPKMDTDNRYKMDPNKSQNGKRGHFGSSHVHFGSILVHFWVISGLFGVHFWSIRSLFWVCLGSIFGLSGVHFWSIWGPFLFHFLSVFGPFLVHFLSVFGLFFVRFWSIFRREHAPLGPIFFSVCRHIPIFCNSVK